MKFADLHLHTVFSDGTYTPAELIKNALKNKLSAIAVTDHDTTEGIAPCIEAVGGEDLEIIPGVELTAESDGTEIHILGYLIDYKNKKLLEKLQSLRDNRIERIYKIVDKLKAMGLGLEAQDVFDISGQGAVGRLHVARAMFKKGLITSIGEAFYKYIGDKCPGYVLGFKFQPKEAIRFILDYGGIPVLAHPYSLRNDELIFKFIDLGLMGLEVHYPEHSQSMVNFYLNIAKERNLLITGGSDCHGSAKPDVKIGSMKVPYELVEKLKEAKDKL